MNIPHYVKVPLRCQFPSRDKITAITQHKDDLVVAAGSMQIYSFRLICSSNQIHLIGQRKDILKKSSDTVVELQSLNDTTLLALIKSSSKKHLNQLNPETKTLTSAINNVDIFAINRYSNEPLVIVSTKSTIFVYKYETKNQNLLFKKLSSFNLESDIFSISFSYPNSIVLTTNKVYSINVQTQQMNHNPSICEPASYTIPISNKLFFTYYARSTMVLDPSLCSNIPPHTFCDESIDHAYNNSIFASLFDTYISLYNFRQFDTKVYLQHPSRITTFNDTFILASLTDIFYICDVTQQYEDVLSNVIPNHTSLDILLSIFEQLWLSNQLDNAFSMLTFNDFELITRILRLFDFFVLPLNDTDAANFMELESFDNQKVLPILYKYLRAIKSNTFSLSKLINTAICQVLIKLDDMKSFVGILEKRKIDENCMQVFFERQKLDKNVIKAHPFYLKHLNKLDEALNEFKNLNNYDEYANILIDNANNFSFVQNNIVFLLKNKISKAIDVLSCNQISPQRSIEYVNKNSILFFPVIRKLIDHAQIVDKDQLATVYISKMLNLLENINNNPKSSYSFTNCMMNNPNSSNQDIEHELTESLCDFIAKNSNIIDPQFLLSQLPKITSHELKLSIYKVTNMKRQILELIYEKNNNLEMCEEYVKKEHNTQLLNEFFSFVKEKIQTDFDAFILQKVQEYIDIVDIDYTFSLIDANQPISESMNLLDQIEQAFIMINKKSTNMEFEAALSASNEFESEYEKAKYAITCIDLNAESRCAACDKPLGYQYIQITPSGQLYHTKCLQTKYKK